MTGASDMTAPPDMTTAPDMTLAPGLTSAVRLTRLPGATPAERIRGWMRQPDAGIDALGVLPGTGRDALILLDRVSASQRQLNGLNMTLLPLMKRLGAPQDGNRFWQRFTGAELARELGLGQLSCDVERAARQGIEQVETVRALIEALTADSRRIDVDIAAIEADIALGKTVSEPGYERLRAISGCAQDFLPRLSRRLANLESMVAALRLTQMQFGVAIEHSRNVVARFEEIRSLLLPLWYQRMGFELFARRVEDTSRAGSTGDSR